MEEVRKPMPMADLADHGKFFSKVVVLACVVAAVLLLGTIAVKYKAYDNHNKERDQNYFAVYLSNGQVYFGHLYNEGSVSPEMTDIYYLRSAQVDKNSQAQYSLVKLGNELHGPKDRIYLNRDHVLYWEELGEKSAVLAAIEDYKKHGSAEVDSADEVPSPTETPKEVQKEAGDGGSVVVD